ncbi:hypothetical protein PL78_09225 [Yersinia entomophaga]|uniref:Lipoprotein Rz1 n=1 Tax=Yersinia entomophaga TaxID=935293 RepID=A0ABN4PWX7_YERET|nr:hypothetical protein PL78_09225 [Yersinia entomophaga]OWF87116.1 hypothetical protein B4914_12920 [Yersinia entomophaga]
MPKPPLTICAVLWPLVLSACSLTPPVPCPIASEPPAPPAWLMLPGPDLLTPLNGIISISGNASPPPTSK